MPEAEFDKFAEVYGQDLGASLAVTGDSRAFYAQERVNWTALCAARLDHHVRSIVDFGCGDGYNAPILAAAFPQADVLGCDISLASIALARRTILAERVSFLHADEWQPGGATDLVFTNGVFHHIPPAQRNASLLSIRRALRPGSLFAFWENNPWNPGTNYVMSRCAFDCDAITITPREATALLSQAGFNVLQLNSMFYFPHSLRALRVLDPLLRKLPLGGQYLALCRS